MNILTKLVNKFTNARINICIVWEASITDAVYLSPRVTQAIPGGVDNVDMTITVVSKCSQHELLTNRGLIALAEKYTLQEYGLRVGDVTVMRSGD